MPNSVNQTWSYSPVQLTITIGYDDRRFQKSKSLPVFSPKPPGLWHNCHTSIFRLYWYNLGATAAHRDVYLIDLCLIGVYPTGVHLMGVYRIGVYLINVHLMGMYLTGVPSP
jgi:hypothetical protein